MYRIGCNTPVIVSDHLNCSKITKHTLCDVKVLVINIFFLQCFKIALCESGYIIYYIKVLIDKFFISIRQTF